MTKGEQARKEIMARSGVMSDCCGSAVLRNKDGADICADCLECCDKLLVKQSGDNALGDKLFNFLDKIGADTICGVLEPERVCDGVACAECPFMNDEVLTGELKALEV